MTSTDRESLRELLLRVLVFALLLLLAWGTFEGLRYLAAGREAGRPAPMQPRAERSSSESDGEDVAMMDLPTFGWQAPTGHYDEFHDIGAVGMVAPFPTGFPTGERYFFYLYGTPWEDNPYMLRETPDERFHIYVEYDPQTLVAQTMYAFMDLYNVSGGGRVAGAIFDYGEAQAGNVVASCGWQIFSTGAAWQVFDISGGTPLVEDRNYLLAVGVSYNALEDTVQIRYGGVPPVSLESTIEVGDLLRTGVAFNSGIGVEDALRPGVALNSGIAISEKLSARNQPTDSGYCYGHEITEEDAGGTIE